jgi:SAM-dependent methyltransferase
MDKESTIDWMKDGQSFDRVAELYDKFRPAYPEKLIDQIIKLSGIPENGRILEIGSGTGKATYLFARRNFWIHCIEPGQNLAAVAARRLKEFSRVSFEIKRFEDSQEHSAEYDLVISAQAFHWIQTDIGYAKIAHSLKNGASIALFWNMSPRNKGDYFNDLEKIYHALVPELENQDTDLEKAIQKRTFEINRCGLFTPVVVRRFPWSATYQTQEYLGLLNTYSDHLRLPEQTRQALFKAIGTLIDAKGGSIRRKYLAVLYFAKKF